MCVSPSWVYPQRARVSDWYVSPEKIPVPCKKCWRCRSNRKADYVGRSLAEAAVSDWSCTLTLTYAPRDDLADKVLTPEHFQRFVRSLRKRGHKIRYLVAGEYGDLKGRAHFHCVLFGKGEPPALPQQTRCWHDAWPHGHMFCDWNVDHQSIAYVVKYLLKWDETPDTWVSMSKKPALGAEWFANKAARDIEAGALPSGFEYRAPGGRRNVPYLMTGATRRDYIKAVIQGFAKTRTIKPERLSEWIYKAVEKHEWKAALAAVDSYWQEAGTDAFIRDLKERLDDHRLSEAQANHQILRTQLSDEELETFRINMIVGLHNGAKDNKGPKLKGARTAGTPDGGPLFDAARRFHLSGGPSAERRSPRAWSYSAQTPFFGDRSKDADRWRAKPANTKPAPPGGNQCQPGESPPSGDPIARAKAPAMQEAAGKPLWRWGIPPLRSVVQMRVDASL